MAESTKIIIDGDIEIVIRADAALSIEAQEALTQMCREAYSKLTNEVRDNGESEHPCFRRGERDAGTCQGDGWFMCRECALLDPESTMMDAIFGPEDGYHSWLAECAAKCSCCPECGQDIPCAGVQQGAPCDQMCECEKGG